VGKVENDLYVSVDYKGSLKNGDVFDSSHGGQPLEVQMGVGQLIAGFENELMGMALNEKKTFTLAPENAYGQRDEGLIREFARADLPPEMEPEVGMMLALQSPEGQQKPAKITHLDDENLSVDLNHPLAGEALTFEIEIVGISESATQSHEGCGSGCACSEE